MISPKEKGRPAGTDRPPSMNLKQGECLKPVFDGQMENHLIGLIVTEADKSLPVALKAGLKGHMLLSSLARTVFLHAVQTHERGEPVDLLSVGAKLSTTENEVLELWALDAPPPSYAKTLATALVRDFRKRMLVESLEAHASRAENEDPEIVSESLSESLIRINQVGQIEDAAWVCHGVDWLTTPIPRPPAILENFFDGDGRLVIVGGAKTKKTYASLQLTICLASGKEFLQWRIPRPKRVLVLNLEIGAYFFQRRATDIMSALQINVADLGDRLSIVNLRRTVVNGDQSCGKIKKLCRSLGTEVLIVDPTYRLMNGDESDQNMVRNLLASLDDLQRETGIALVLVSHATKGVAGDRQAIDRVAGSGLFARDYDCLIAMAGHAEDDDAVVIETIARNYPPAPPFSIRFENGAFQLDEELEPEIRTSKTVKKQTPPRGPSMYQALDVFRDQGPMLATVAEQRLREIGFTVRGWRAIVDQLTTEKLLVKREVGWPRKVVLGQPDERLEKFVAELQHGGSDA